MLIHLEPQMPQPNQAVMVLTSRPSDGQRFLRPAWYCVKESGVGYFYHIVSQGEVGDRIENVVGWSSLLTIGIDDDGLYSFDGT